jgi:hypothetical protein
VPTYETNTVTPGAIKAASPPMAFVDNEVYINTSKGWVNLRGPQGIQGPKGDPGPSVVPLVTDVGQVLGANDGDERYFQDNQLSGQGSLWRFRYTPGIAISFKWLFAGGGDLLRSLGSANANAGTSNTPFTMQYTIILPGNYDVKFGARMYANPSGGATGTPASMIMYVEQMRAGAVVNSAAIDSWLPGMPVQSFTAAVRESNEERFSCQFGDVLRVRTYSPTYNGAFEQPFMRVRPVCVTL